MKVIKVEDGMISKVTYPRADMGAIVGKPDDTLFYVINEEDKPDYDSNLYSLTTTTTLGEDTNETYPDLLNAYITYTKVQLSNDSIISKLSTSLGAHLDENYPVWKRIKHINELSDDDITDERKEYIESMQTWEQDCRNEFDSRVTELTDNNTLPSFEWEDKPDEL
jgi:hypothetical protein